MGLLGLLSGLFSGGAGPETVLLSAADVSAALDRGAGAILAPQGFVSLGPRRWIRTRASGYHDLFEYEAMKGASYWVVWGPSFNFVPWFTEAGLRWKRTAKSSRVDIRLDRAASIDAVALRGSGLSSEFRGDPFRAMEDRARKAASLALADLDHHRSLADFQAAHDRWRAVDGDHPMYTQFHLAGPLLKFAAGDLEGGEAGLIEASRRLRFRLDDPLLAKARAAAIALVQET